MEDLLQHFTNPNIMDIKMGKRFVITYNIKMDTKFVVILTSSNVRGKNCTKCTVCPHLSGSL